MDRTKSLPAYMIVCEECMPSSMKYEELTIGVIGPRQCELCKSDCSSHHKEDGMRALRTPRRTAVRGVLINAGVNAVLTWLNDHDMNEMADTIKENLR